MSRPQGYHVGHERSSEKHEIPQKIHHLVPHTFIGETKAFGIHNLGFVENHRILQRSSLSKATLSERLHLRKESEGSGPFKLFPNGRIPENTFPLRTYAGMRMLESIGYAKTGSGEKSDGRPHAGISYNERHSRIKRKKLFGERHSLRKKLSRKKRSTSVSHGDLLCICNDTDTPYLAERQSSQEMLHCGKRVSFSEEKGGSPTSSLKRSFPKIKALLSEAEGYPSFLGGAKAKRSRGSPMQSHPRKKDFFPKSVIFHEGNRSFKRSRSFSIRLIFLAMSGIFRR